MLKITRAANREVVIKLRGRIGAENIGELEKLISAEADGRRIILDLRDLKLVDQDAVSFLRRCEADSLQLRNCPAYIQVDHGRTAMSTEARRAIEKSRPMPKTDERGESVRYETKVLSHWDRQERAQVAQAFMYEIAWIPERQCWRSCEAFDGTILLESVRVALQS